MAKVGIKETLLDMMELLQKQANWEGVLYESTVFSEASFLDKITKKNKFTKEQDLLINAISDYNHSTYEMLGKLVGDADFKRKLKTKTLIKGDKITYNLFIDLQYDVLNYFMDVLKQMRSIFWGTNAVRIDGIMKNTEGLLLDISKYKDKTNKKQQKAIKISKEVKQKENSREVKRKLGKVRKDKEPREHNNRSEYR